MLAESQRSIRSAFSWPKIAKIIVKNPVNPYPVRIETHKNFVKDDPKDFFSLLKSRDNAIEKPKRKIEKVSITPPKEKLKDSKEPTAKGLRSHPTRSFIANSQSRFRAR